MARRKPKSIRIGAFNYKIVYHRKLGQNLGEVDTNRKRIDIWKHESNQALRDSILHEILHIIFEDLIENLEKMSCDTHDKEEFLIRIITPRLLQVLIENPEFVEWLQS